MKTTKQWVEELPSPIREKALQYEKDFWSNGKEIPSAKLALAVGFDWKNSNEGHEYWSEVYRGLI